MKLQSAIKRIDLKLTPDLFILFFLFFKIPIQAIRAVNELVRTLASVRTRLNGQKALNPDEEVQ